MADYFFLDIVSLITFTLPRASSSYLVSVVAVTPTLPSASGSSAPSTSNGFFSNQGAIAGVFTVVGLVVLALVISLIVIIIRRHHGQQFDRDVETATAPAPNFLNNDGDDPYRHHRDHTTPPHSACRRRMICTSSVLRPGNSTPTHVNGGGVGTVGVGVARIVDYAAYQHLQQRGLHPGQYVQQADFAWNVPQATYNTTPHASSTLVGSLPLPKEQLSYAAHYPNVPEQDADEGVDEDYTDEPDADDAGQQRERQKYDDDD
ncbi:hypothetical protein C0995_002459 [Termitomyces sp. Mi166|nr:hypothetical protein C0995_002459 [Termitomyces sp. Mi166\